MSPRIRYSDEMIGEVEVAPDFLPLPAEPAFREEGVKVTLALSRRSVEFFKAEASKHQRLPMRRACARGHAAT